MSISKKKKKINKKNTEQKKYVFFASLTVNHLWSCKTLEEELFTSTVNDLLQ